MNAILFYVACVTTTRVDTGERTQKCKHRQKSFKYAFFPEPTAYTLADHRTQKDTYYSAPYDYQACHLFALIQIVSSC